MTTYDDLLPTAVAAAQAGARVLAGYFDVGASLEVCSKGEHDYVSRADRESEAAILGEIRRRFPEHSVLAEESGADAGNGDYEWVVDPLDGTTNFLQGLPVYCVSVACRRGREVVAGVVLDPVTDNLFTAARGSGAFRNGRRLQASGRASLAGAFLATGYPWRAKAALDLYLAVFHDLFLEARSIRRCGAAALDLAWTAAGVYDGFFEFCLAPWDLAAGSLLIEEAGGRVSDLDGGDGTFERGNIVAGGAALHPRLLAAIGRHAGEATLDRLVPRRETKPQPALAASGGPP